METEDGPLPLPLESPLPLLNDTEPDRDWWPLPLPEDSALTTLNDGPSKHVASAEPFSYTMMV
jgi:hypothetical protein